MRFLKAPGGDKFLDSKALLIGLLAMLVGLGIVKFIAPSGGWTIGYAFAYFYLMFARK